MQSERLSWSSIREKFNGMWIELTDVEWDWKSTYPRVARVRYSAEDRNELLAKVNRLGRLNDSIILYVSPAHSLVERNQVSVTL